MHIYNFYLHCLTSRSVALHCLVIFNHTTTSALLHPFAPPLFSAYPSTFVNSNLKYHISSRSPSLTTKSILRHLKSTRLSTPRLETQIYLTPLYGFTPSPNPLDFFKSILSASTLMPLGNQPFTVKLVDIVRGSKCFLLRFLGADAVDFVTRDDLLLAVGEEEV